MVTNLHVPRDTSSEARDRAQEYLNQAGESAAQMVSSAETCARDHVETAVWTAFIGGLFFGALAGWFAAERNERRWYGELERTASRLRDRFHW